MIFICAWIAVRWKIHAMISQEALVLRRIVVGGDTENHAVTRGNALLQGDETGDFGYAGATPASPKIQNNYFATKVGEVRGFAAELHREVLGRFPGDGGFALAIMWEGEKREDRKGETHAAPGEEFAEEGMHMKL